MMDILDALEPDHARIMNVVRLVIENRELIDFANDLAQIRLALIGPADRFRAEWGEEVSPSCAAQMPRLRPGKGLDAIGRQREADPGVLDA